MQTSVELRPPFDYSPWFLVGALVLLGVVVVVLTRQMRKWRQQPAPVPLPVVPVKRLKEDVRREYLEKLAELERNLPNMTVRQAHQVLSEVVRRFVFEVSGVKMQNYSLQEIRLLGVTELSDLVAECYVPEFATEARGDIAAAVQKARQIIGGWQ